MIDRVTLCSTVLGEDGKREPPLGALYVASALEAEGVEVDFRDYQLASGASSFSGARLAEFLDGHAPVVALSGFVDMLPAIVDAARRLREARPETTIILGGPGPSASANRLLELYPWIDAVVRGEGEETIREWASRKNGRTIGLTPIAGMSYREGGRVVIGPDRARTLDLEAVPRPAYHLADWSAYSHARVITTRGCAYRCSFCDVTALWGNRSVYRDVDAVIDEMLDLRDRHGKSVISIVDDTFVQDRKRVRAFCRRLIERRAGVHWACFGRINLMSPELIDAMAGAGCRSVFYGIDSGSPAVIARTHKMVRPESVVPVIRDSAAAFGNVEASFIWGYPFETLDDFQMTLDLAAEVSTYAPTVSVSIHALSPLPNSPIYREFAGDLVEPEPEDRPWLLLPDMLGDPRGADLRDMVRAAPDVYPGFFGLPTPDKAEKRRRLAGVIASMSRTLGSTMLDRRAARLMDEDDADVERSLLDAADDAIDRVGVGLAVTFLRRSRRRRGVPGPAFAGTRRAGLTRQRNEA